MPPPFLDIFRKSHDKIKTNNVSGTSLCSLNFLSWASASVLQRPTPTNLCQRQTTCDIFILFYLFIFLKRVIPLGICTPAYSVLVNVSCRMIKQHNSETQHSVCARSNKGRCVVQFYFFLIKGKHCICYMYLHYCCCFSESMEVYCTT